MFKKLRRVAEVIFLEIPCDQFQEWSFLLEVLRDENSWKFSEMNSKSWSSSRRLLRVQSSLCVSLRCRFVSLKCSIRYLGQNDTDKKKQLNFTTSAMLQKEQNRTADVKCLYVSNERVKINVNHKACNWDMQVIDNCSLDQEVCSYILNGVVIWHSATEINTIHLHDSFVIRKEQFTITCYLNTDILSLSC